MKPIFLPFITCTVLLLLTHNTTAAQVRPETIRQIKSLLAEKQLRTPVERKISSQLLQAVRESRGGRMTAGVNLLPAKLTAGTGGGILVDINANVTQALLAKLDGLQTKILFSSKQFHSIRAEVNLTAVEMIASYSEVKMIKPAMQGRGVGVGSSNNGSHAIGNAHGYSNFLMVDNKHKSFRERTEAVKKQLQKYLMMPGIGAVTSQGDHAHGADTARNTYGYEGQGIRIGLLSGSYNTTPGDPASGDVLAGDLPGIGNPYGDTVPVTVLQDLPYGISGDEDEGRAMLQIVHDLAPKAQLFFATAAYGGASFASNILALRAAPNNCDIIIDDYHFLDEPVFQDGLIAQAVNSVTASGGLYFSSAGNEGSPLMQTSGVWEGDFNDAGSPAFEAGTKAGTIHNFGTLTAPIGADPIIPSGVAPYGYVLNWSDPLGGSNNDYDLFVVDAEGNVVLSSTDIQDGTQDPMEVLEYPQFSTGYQLVVFKAANAQVKAINLNNVDGALQFATTGQVFGHFAAANAFSVAATDASLAYPNRFVASDQVEFFSSDGPRRIFFNADSTPVTPGNFLFGTNGGTVRNKPDITAADGVSTTVKALDLNTFYGTSAAGPHAGAIAALLKSANPSLTGAQVRNLLTSTALDIEAPGYDINSGYGIVQAFQAMQALNPKPLPNISVGQAYATEGSFSNHDGYLQPGEIGNVYVTLINPSLAGATLVSAKIITNAPGITILHDSAYYGSIASNSRSINNAMPFTVAINSSVPCASAITFWIIARFSNTGNTKASYQGFKVTVPISSYCPATVEPCTPVKITSHFITGGAINQPYLQTFTASGGSSSGVYSFSYTGTLPLGLGISNDSLSGNPAQPGGFPVIINANDPTGCPGGTKKDTIFIGGDAPSITAINGTPQSVIAGQPFAETFKVRVHDTANLPLSGVTVTFTVPAGKATGYFSYQQSVATAFTDSNGIAAAPVLTATRYGGNYTLTASVIGALPSAQFQLSNTCISTVVTTSADTGVGSLRYIITNACAGAIVTFAPGISQINLTSGEIDIWQALTVRGPGAGQLTISGSNQSRIFSINPYTSISNKVRIHGLTIQNGFSDINLNGPGAGIAIYGGNVKISGCVVTNNHASATYPSLGGGIFSDGDTVIIENCSIVNNTANDIGGGIDFAQGVLIVNNSTIANNQLGTTDGSQGGGIYNNSQLAITNCTVYCNTAQMGGNIYNSPNNGGRVTLKNTIVAGGILAGADSSGADLYGNFISGDFNLLQDVSTTTIYGATTNNITGVSAGLLPLGDYGGPTPTLLPLPNSPGINQGDTALTDSAFDQRHFTRVAGGRADIGAVETNYLSEIKAGSPQSTIVNTKFSALKGKLTESGNPIAGVNVIFKAPASGASGSFAGNSLTATVITTTDGIAAAPVFTANGIAGSYAVTDSIAPTLANIVFTLTNTLKPAIAASGSNVAIDNGDNPSVLAYPNPVHNTLTVVINGNEKQTISIFDAGGRIVARYQAAIGKQDIDVSKWAAGTYLILISGGQKADYSIKVIKN